MGASSGGPGSPKSLRRSDPEPQAVWARDPPYPRDKPPEAREVSPRGTGKGITAMLRGTRWTHAPKTLRIPPRDSLRAGTARRGRVLPHPLPLGATAYRRPTFPGSSTWNTFSPAPGSRHGNPLPEGLRHLPRTFSQCRNGGRRGGRRGFGNTSQKCIRAPRAEPPPTVSKATPKASQAFSDRARAKTFNSLSINRQKRVKSPPFRASFIYRPGDGSVER